MAWPSLDLGIKAVEPAGPAEVSGFSFQPAPCETSSIDSTFLSGVVGIDTGSVLNPSWLVPGSCRWSQIGGPWVPLNLK